ncbi:hypothetical protein [Tranquillimonas alkanivorans]|uniref:Uncharacterized protein n=1 Tax=Tranquillimonas alkanivorans TaxID=441119 RepID=A0A1I5VT78_9RHOB|nr:hypothetical protein [Tranquillimonas alkanivorans]SFQ10487.1 hypothetical protein SAMN04488047_13515 [Tranquillimonas alkanivorans]
MPSPLTHDRILRLVRTGCLHLEANGRRVSFTLHNGDLEISGPLNLRPDWSKEVDGRPGLMPIIHRMSDGESVFSGAELEGVLDEMSEIYEALRKRLSPAKMLRRRGGRWLLIPHAQCECA